MPRYARIENGVVTNVILAESAPDGAVLCEGIPVSPGDTFANGSFQAAPAQPVPHAVPQQISRAQGKAMLITMGLWQQVLDYVAAIPDATQRALAEVALHDTQNWERSSPFLTTASQALGLTREQMDDMFIQAAEIRL